ncbi:MAG: hypothetical protein KBT27_01590 [Prevotellaceae bacterium]|nr:hypothetical protein [Candidatus Faecinaster equi]
MCEIDFLSRMLETNELLLSLTVEQLVKVGQENSELLRKALIIDNNDEQAMQSDFLLSNEQKGKLNIIFRNIIILSNSIDADYKNATLQFARTIKSFLLNFPTFQKIEMPDDIKAKYEDFTLKTGNDSEQGLLIRDIRNLLYK